ncbi:hypothetical protein ABK040_010137 [Willaertia magna]
MSCCGGSSSNNKSNSNNNNTHRNTLAIGGDGVISATTTSSTSTIGSNNGRARSNTKYQTNYDELFKVIVVGDSSVGKTCFLNKIINGNFAETFMPTVGVDLKVKFIEIDGKTIKIQIWDTAGQERYRNLTRSYYRGSDGIILMYDITQEKTFNNLNIWMKEVKKNVGEENIFILGNKTDLEYSRQVKLEQAKQFCEQYQLPYEEISCKMDTTEELEEKVIKRIAKRIIEIRNKERESYSNHSSNNNSPQLSPVVISTSSSLNITTMNSGNNCLEDEDDGIEGCHSTSN